jgi:hypothetical protein
MTNVKVVVADQAKNIYQYKNKKWKVHDCNVNIALIKSFKSVILK